MKRSRINPRSAKKIAADKEKPEIRAAVFKRDGHQCILGSSKDLPACSGAPLTPPTTSAKPRRVAATSSEDS